MSKYAFPGKLFDLGPQPGGRVSALDKWWNGNGLRTVTEFQKTAKMPPGFKFWDGLFLCEHFGIKGIQFGNWLSQEDRYNYLMSAGVGLYHLCRTVLNAKKPISLGQRRLSLCFGSRGLARSSAHYQAGKHLININRWKKKDGDRGNGYLTAIQKTANYGSFAHEFGHWMDAWDGGFESGGRSINLQNHKNQHKPGTSAFYMEKIFLTLFFDSKGKETAWLKRFKEGKLQPIGYWYCRAEIWARYFETTCDYILRQEGIVSDFMCHPKYYSSWVYPDQALIKKCLPTFRQYCAAWLREVGAKK